VESNPLKAWVKALPTPDQLNNGVYFDDECCRLLKSTAMCDALGTLPVKKAYESQIAPLMASKPDVWPVEVRNVSPSNSNNLNPFPCSGSSLRSGFVVLLFPRLTRTRRSCTLLALQFPGRSWCETTESGFGR
jgi:hypothetical protein